MPSRHTSRHVAVERPHRRDVVTRKASSPSIATLGGDPSRARGSSARFTGAYDSRHHLEKREKIVRIEDIRMNELAAVFIGRNDGAEVSSFVISHRRGEDSGSHRHPCEETFVVQDGAAELAVDGETLTVEAGTIVVVPAGTVHSFKGASGGITRQINIHPAAEMVIEWVE